MKKFLQVASVAVFFLMFSGAMWLSAQNPAGFQASPVYISRYVDTVSGKVYFVHQVQKGHTMYSIGKAYQASAEDMLKDSPDNQVQIEEYIYIPFKASLVAEGVSLLPFEGRKPWAVALLERQEVEREQARIEDERMGKRDMQDSDRAEAEADRNDSEEGMTVFADSTLLAETEIEEVLDTLDVKDYRDTLNIALMLPLYSSTPDNRRAYVYLPFMEGAGLAWLEHRNPEFFAEPTPVADSTQEAEADLAPITEEEAVPAPFLRLEVYDLTESANRLDEILQDSAFARTDAIMAAAYAVQYPKIDSFSLLHRIPVIHPVSERDSMSARNPFFVQLCASHHTQRQAIARLIQQYHPKSKVLILSDSTPSEQKKAQKMLELLPSAEYRMFSPDLETVLSELPTSTPYVIVPFYAKEITAVKTVLPLRQSKNITIVAPVSWLDYSSIELGYFLQNNLTIYTTFLPNENDATYKEFAKRYYLLHKTLPSYLAYQGYTSFAWLLDRLSHHNANFLRHLDEDEADAPQRFFNPHSRADLPGFEDTDILFLRLTETGLEKVTVN
ncbi:MAG: hypothetical protein K2J57_01305 [Bacteroidales bacterium]|nr:hypothetical protein [Bacteroidales bacterium]